MTPGQLVKLDTISFSDFEFSRINIDFSYIPAGTFLMGSLDTDDNSLDTDDEAKDNEKPQHEVSLTKSFLMQRTLVTQKQWFSVMGTTAMDGSAIERPNHPAQSINWFDAVDFCNKLSNKTGLPNSYIEDRYGPRLVENPIGYRLPTEAEWEYACRAGTTTPRYSNNDRDSHWFWYIDKIAWYVENSRYISHEVGEKKPNSWNLYDMLGNMDEWTQDLYLKYFSSSQIDPLREMTGNIRVLRGGSFRSDRSEVRCASRRGIDAETRTFDVGFRICRTIG